MSTIARRLREAIRRKHDLDDYAALTLGPVNAGLFLHHGKLRCPGPFSGNYVTGITSEQGVKALKRLIDALARGETIPVILMHNYYLRARRLSVTRLHDGCLLQEYDDGTCLPALQ